MNGVATELDTYIADVERFFSDLPDEDRRELLDDVREHVTEVAAEDEGSLAERLGPPERYAAELRAAAGLPPYVAPDELSATQRLRRRFERSPLAALANSAPVRAVRGFMPELRPAWWVIRGYLAAVIVSVAFFGRPSTDGPPWPTIDGSWVAGLALLVVFIALSILAGRAVIARQRWLGLAVAANVAIVLAFAGVLPTLREVNVPTASVRMVDADPFGFVQHGDGAPITHICAYDEDGKRVKGVQLFDQMGRPVEPERKLAGVLEDMDIGARPFIERKLRAAADGFECPKKLEDLRPQTRIAEPDVPLPKLRRFAD